MTAPHTPGPWKLTTNGTYGPWVDSCDNFDPEYGAASHDVGIERHSIASTHGKSKRENAARIVACVNACEGLDPTGIRGLIEAAESMERVTTGAIEDDGDGGHALFADVVLARDMLRSTLAAVKVEVGKC